MRFFYRRLLELIFLSMLTIQSTAQSSQGGDSTYNRILDINARTYQSHDTVWIYSGICKPLKITMLTGQLPADQSTVPSSEKRKLLLTGSGDINYQHFRRESSSDNLLLLNSSSDIAALRLNLVYKESYPVSIFLRYNQASPFQLDNQYEFNISFDNRGYKELIRDKITNAIKNKFLQKHMYLMASYERVFSQLEEQKQILQSPVYLQQQVQNRVSNPNLPSVHTLPSVNVIQASNPIGGITSRVPNINANNPLARFQFLEKNLPSVEEITGRLKDSVDQRIEGVKEDIHGSLERRKDSLHKLLKKYEDSLASYKDRYNKQLDSVNKELSDLVSMEQIKMYADKKGIKDSLTRNRWADILMKTNIRFGKFILNNSELTVNNIFLSGMSIKYGEEKFIQLSAGFYDFAFREMFNLGRDSAKAPKRSVIGIKIGKTDGKNLKAINFYIGKKEKIGSVPGELRTVAGISIERNFYFSKNLKLNLELAKSTTRLTNNANKQEQVIKDLFSRFSTRTIGGYVSLKAFLPKTKTDAEINYRYWGTQFESFNGGQYFNPQTNLAAKIIQPFFSRKLNLSSGIRYTDFRNYGIASNMKSRSLLASLNATMRIKKLPILSIGYYPGSQLYWVDNSKLYEYFYYIFNTTASHYFTIGKMPMQAVGTYNKFYNKYTDSLVNGSKSYFNVFLTAWEGKFSYQANYSFQDMEIGSLSTLEVGATYGGATLKLGGSIKWNFTNDIMRVGYTSNVGLLFSRFGTINFIYDRSFLPERNGKFIPVTAGQLQLIKPLKFRIWQRG